MGGTGKIWTFHAKQTRTPAPRALRNRSNKFAKNVTKRGNVPAKKSTDEEVERKLNPYMVAMFVFLVVGSSLTSVFKLFQSTPDIPKDE
eukprot:scaffold2192_cov268-Chaetoceros_neogracile.AAC.37